MLYNKIKQTESVVALVLLLLFCLVLIVLWPMVVIWALNTLFPLLAITYTFWSWLAVVILNVTYLVPRSNTK